MVLVEAYARGERKVGAHADEHPSPMLVDEVEIELVHPALLELQVRAVVVLVSNRHQDARRFPSLEHYRHPVGWAITQIWLDELIAPLLVGGFDNWHVPFRRPVLEPILKLIGNLIQRPARYPFSLPIGIEETEHSFGLLERLDQSVEQKRLKAAVTQMD